MNPEKPPPPPDAPEEISALIETLHETGQRLEELTGGEVDAVADREGRTFVLRRAQDRLRHNEAAKQAAILNALPAHVALLDTQGIIISVNEAWRQFAGATVIQCPGHAIGVNYLEICDSEGADDSSEAHQVAEGIRSVLGGWVKSFSLEYSCHSRTRQRWFVMTVTPLADDPPNGAVVMHLDVTAERQAEESLRESERRFSDMLGNVELASVMLDREARITYCNEYLLRLTGWRYEEVIGRDWFEVFMPAELGDMKPVFAALLDNQPEARHRDHEIFTRSRERRLIRWNNSVLRSGAGDVIGVASIGEDITEQKRAESRIKRLNRVYAVLSGIKALIVRARDRDALFTGACRIAVEEGGLPMTWIGIVDRSVMKIAVVASAGVNEGLLSAIKERLSLDDGVPLGSNMAARAIREKKADLSNDAQNDPKLALSKKHVEAAIRSMAMLPLIVADEALGVLGLYSEETGFFDEEEMKLLTELAGDIAFAVEHIDKAEKLERTTRVNAMLSGINGAIVRIRDREELFVEACRIAVETGGLRFAWLSLVDEAEMRLRSVAMAGPEDGFLETIRERLSLRDDAPEGHGIGAKAVRGRCAWVVNDIEADADLGYRNAYADRGIKSVAALPLFIAGRVVGAFGLHAAEAGFFDNDEMTLLNELAGNIAFALEHIEKEEKVQRLTRVYAVLSGINALIVRARDRDELFGEACRIAVGVGGLKLAWVGLVDWTAMRLKPVAWEGAGQDYVERMPLSLDASDEKFGLGGRVVHEKNPIIVEDMEHDPRVLLHREAKAQNFHSLVMLPLMLSDTVVGVLALYANEIAFFNENEMKLLLELAGNIAFALEHIEKEEKVRRLTRVQAVQSGINTLIVRVRERGELFREACRIAVQSGQFRLAWVAVADPRDQRVTAVAWAGDEHGYAQLTRPTADAKGQGKPGLGAKAIETRIPVVCNDIEADGSAMRYAKEALERGYRSAAAFPLVVGGTAIAALVLYAAEAGLFDDEEMRLLKELAGDISFAIDHLEKEEKVRRLTRVQAVLSGINALIVRVRERDKLLGEACRIVVDDGGFLMTWIGIVDRSTMKIAVVGSAGVNDGLLSAIKERLSLNAGVPLGNDLAARAIRRKKAGVSNDAQSDPTLALSEKHAESGVRSMAMLPLIVSDEAVGVLGLYSEEIGFFDEEEMKLLTELAGDIAFALEHIAGQQKLENLSRIRAVSSEINAAIIRIRDREGLLRETGRIALEHGKFELVWIATLDPDEQKVHPVAWTGFSPDAAHAVSWANIGATRGTLSEAIQTRKAAVRDDIQAELPVGKLRQEALQKGCRSTACLPLVVDDKVVALIALFAQGVGFFDSKELALLNEVAADVSFALQAIEKQKKLEYLSYYDALTGLANRSLFLERVAQYMRSAASGGHKLALFLVDLERFKNINDSLGQPAGDALLKQVAQWLTRRTGDANLLARVEADHFAVVLPQVRQDGDIVRFLEQRIAEFLEHPFRLNDAVFRIALKLGVALFPDDGADADTLFKNAEAALKKAKARGDRYLFYTEKMTEAVAGKLTLENQLRQALDKGEFVLHYQPKVSLASGKLTSAEALIRWNDPRTGLVPPGRFIPVLEETGLIYEVGRWALRQAIEDYLRWRGAGLPAVRMAVNVSPLQLRHRGFVAEIQQAISIDAHAAAGLELEITESLIMEDVKHNIASLKAIRAMGVTIAIDDFGTGFSSLSYLAKLPVDTLKIDRSFVIDMTAAPEGLALVSTIITLAHSLKLKVVAEGVETEEQSRLLRLLDCDEMQGYLFSKPLPSEIFETRFLAPPAAATSSACLATTS